MASFFICHSRENGNPVSAKHYITESEHLWNLDPRLRGDDNFKLYKKKGFTLIEVLLTMALVAIIALLASPFYGSFIFSQEVSVTRDELQGSFAKAQLYSMTGKSNSSWGVAVNDGNIILFQGDSFVSRDQGFDENFVIHSSVTISGMDEVVFAQTTGRPNDQPTIAIAGNGEIETLMMNKEGVLENQ